MTLSRVKKNKTKKECKHLWFQGKLNAVTKDSELSQSAGSKYATRLAHKPQFILVTPSGHMTLTLQVVVVAREFSPMKTTPSFHFSLFMD